jgi:hypothetical protein
MVTDPTEGGVYASAVLGATLPDWVNPDNARTITLVIGIGALVLIVLVLRFVQKVVTKVAMTALLALIGFGAWYYRADLADCAKTCECRILGQDIKIPKDKNPECRQGATPAPKAPTR